MAASRRGRSIRFRITVIAALAVALVLGIFAVVLIGVQRRELTRNVDSTLRLRADDIAAFITASDEVPTVLSNRIADETVAQLVSLDGEVVAASTNIPPGPIVPSGATTTETIRTKNILLAENDDDDFRLLSRPLDVNGQTFVLHVARTLKDVREGTAILRTSLLIAIPSVVVLLAALVWWLVGRTLRPVEAIRSEVADIGGSDLHRRVPEPTTEDEIARLATTMNGMLDRLQDATLRQQRFVSDASHELRSPLTRIRTELEVDLARPAEADLEATAHSVLAESTELQHLVDDLLHLARTDAGAHNNEREPVDLDDIVLREARRLKANERRSVDIAGVSAASVSGDRDQLTRAVRNLVDNAVRHASTTVTLTLAEQNSAAVLTVADDGSGVPPDQHEQVFERFARLDDARSRDSGGTGLGLAITRDIVVRHGGKIFIDSEAAGARFVVEIPLSSD